MKLRRKLMDQIADGTPSNGTTPAPDLNATIAKAVADGIAAGIARAQADRQVVTQNAQGVDAQPTPGVQMREQKDVGSGWTVARFLRVEAKARKDHTSPMEAAKHYAQTDRRYGEIVKALGEIDAREKALNAGLAAQGAALLQTTPIYQDYIDLLRPAISVLSFNPPEIEMPNGVMPLGSIESDATAAYENETGTGPNASQPGTGNKQLVARKLMVVVPIKNDWLRRANAGADTLIRQGVVERASVRKDAAFLTGDGAQDTPRGIISQVAAANVFSQVGTDYAGISGTLHKARRLMKAANCPMFNVGWIMSPRTEEYLRSLTATTGMFIYGEEMNRGTLLGHPFRVSTQIPENLGGSANESKILLCDFADVLIGKALDLTVDVLDGAAYKNSSGNVVSAFSADETVMRLIDEHDIVLRHGGCASVATGITWGA